MRDIIHSLSAWLDQDKAFVTATVIKTWGSGPRKVGSGMAIGPDQEILGSVSGGCVEGDVIKQSEQVRVSGDSKVLHYGITDDEAWEVGLSCGGQIEILLEKADPSIWKELTTQVLSDKGSVMASKLEISEATEVFQDGHYGDTPVGAIAQTAYKSRKSGVYEVEGEPYFINVLPRRSKLLIVGAAHISAELVQVASLYDFETILVDPRGLFSAKTSFVVEPTNRHQKWPEEVLTEMDLNSDVYAVMLTHDPKIDDQALHILLRSEVAYIGALGSRKTHQKRTNRLIEAGFTEQEIAKIHAPIGVDINAQYPGEIALSIISELIKTRNQYL